MGTHPKLPRSWVSFFIFSVLSLGQLTHISATPQLKADLIAQSANNYDFTFGQFPVTRRSSNSYLSQAMVEGMVPLVLRPALNSSDSSGDFIRQTCEVLEEQVTSDDGKCQEAFCQLLEQLKSSKIPETWVLHMIDSWGKVPSGILSGNMVEPGDFLECINTRGEYSVSGSSERVEVKGHYCLTYVIPNSLPTWPGVDNDGSGFEGRKNLSGHGAATLKQLLDSINVVNPVGWLSLGPAIGTCLPAACSATDIQMILSVLFNGTGITPFASSCATDEKEPFGAAEYVMITILGLIGFFCIVGTVVDVIDLNRMPSDVGPPGLPKKMLLAFSVYTNTKKWANTNVGSSDNLGCLHGLRFLSMAWVILVHSWSMTVFQYNTNALEIVVAYKNWSYFPMLNGSISVDTFFCLSGALMAYNFLRELDKNKGKFNYPMMVVHRILRVTPVYMIMIGIMATLVPYFGAGPQWSTMDFFSKTCEKNWWHNLLYINNLVNYTGKAYGECYDEGWYLANDMQFFILAPLVIYPLWRWRSVGYVIFALLSIFSIVITPAIMATKELDPTMAPFGDMKSYVADIYEKPWTRCGTYIVGLILGYFLYLRRKEPGKFERIPPLVVLCGWTTSTVLALAGIYWAIPYLDPFNADMAHSAWHSYLYGGIHRFGWGVAISWIIFACVNGNGGVVNEFLSWRAFVPLARLTFCTYISAYHLQMYYHMSHVLRPVYFSSYSVTYVFFGHLIASGLLGFLLVVTMESPFLQLEKLLLPPSRGPSAPAARPVNNNNKGA